jgi:hypothetical protein
MSNAALSSSPPARQPESPPASVPLREAIRSRLVYSLGRTVAEANVQDWYVATALAVRDRIVERWLDVRNANRANKKKRVYYLSIEFLIGRLLFDTLVNLDLLDEAREALQSLGVDAIVARRRQLRRNQLACLMLAQGVPLLLAGDEVANSQSGNNNAYCQDNETGWVDWSRAGSDDDLTDFVAELSALRNRFAQLKPHRWLEGKRGDGAYDIKWLTPAANEMGEDDWNFADGRFLSCVLAAANDAG